MYPPLPYMERVAQKHDVIPLRFPVRLTTGQEVQEVPVRPGQVCVTHNSPASMVLTFVVQRPL